MAPWHIQPLHLARRFFGSLHPGPPAPDDEAWARANLLAGELALWERMSNPDRRHAVAVARAVVARWSEVEVGREPGGRPATGADRPDREVVAAALLHDVGKVESGFGTLARVAATLVWAVLDDGRARTWSEVAGGGVRARLGRYRLHPELGAILLRQAGAAPLTSAWAEEHHRSEDRWTVTLAVGRLLKDCDDD